MKPQAISVKELLLTKGVKMPNPGSVQMGDDIDPDRISGDGVIFYSGCKIFGNSTLILQGAELGYEGPVTVENCFIGPKVKLKGGFFKKSVFLQGVQTGSGSHIREGTILEEEAIAAHTVGLKQTILFPYVTLGSLINFCDCLMSGGTSRENHSEVGSSYIHFNYTPNQDKATPSLIGDVPQGVMLNQPPIFLGGQGGLVGPCRLAFGTTIAAGSICRKDEIRTGRFIFEGQKTGGNIPHIHGLYRSVKRITINNIIYIANLIALLRWYVNVRVLFVAEGFPDLLLHGLIDILKMNIRERIKRLGHFCFKLPDSAELYQQVSKKKSNPLVDRKYELFEKWPEIEAVLNQFCDRDGDPERQDNCLKKIQLGIKRRDKDYLTVIKELNPEDAANGTQWLQGIVDEITDAVLRIIPSFE